LVVTRLAGTNGFPRDRRSWRANPQSGLGCRFGDRGQKRRQGWRRRRLWRLLLLLIEESCFSLIYRAIPKFVSLAALPMLNRLSGTDSADLEAA
jgi:hypothetical protein